MMKSLTLGNYIILFLDIEYVNQMQNDNNDNAIKQSFQCKCKIEIEKNLMKKTT